MQRREFLRATVVAAGAVLTGCTTEQGAAPATTPDPAGTLDPALFPQSVCSGDPRPDGAIVWTRAVDAAKAGSDVALTLTLATDEAFKHVVQFAGKKSKAITATAKHDGCVKVRLVGLKPGQLYWYRFASADGKRVSPVGRFKTAPAPDADVAVRYAIACCQDFNGKYYNSYQRMAQEELDFFVHLGDYVYETTGDPAFQKTTPDRVVKFGDTAGAMAFGPQDKPTYYAAQSLSNYRDLYKTYRSDPDLQRVHEKMAMLAVWDDHEFSDDCWQQHASYFDGEKDELQPERRANADQAWFEFMPVDLPAGPDFEYDPKAAFPQSLRIYRDFQFGQHLHLVLTDLRRYRSDHLVPEDALPGAIAITGDQLTQALGKLPDSAQPYLDIGQFAGGKYAKFLKDHAADLKISAARVQGPVAVPWLNARLKDLEKAPDVPPAIADADTAALPKGWSFQQMLKFSGFSSLGSRYLVTRGPFELYAKLRYAESKGASEHAMGDEQEAWFLETMQKSKTTWKCWGNEYTMQRREVDLSGISSLPEAFRQRFLLSAEDWDGMPNRRDKLLQALAAVPGSVIVSGDIHAFFAGVPMADSDPQKRVVEFVGGAISSGTYMTLLVNQANSDPTLAAAGAASLAYTANVLLLGLGTGPVNPNLGYARVDLNGFMVAEAAKDAFTVTFLQVEEDANKARLPADKVAAAFAKEQFRTLAGGRDLQHLDGGAWKTWDPATYKWK